MKAALLQVESRLEEPLKDRVRRVGELVTGLEGVDLVILPELWASGYFAFDSYRKLAEPLDGPLVAELRNWARAIGAHVQVGSVLECSADGRLHNCALLIDGRGDVLSTYRKVHVFGYQSLESQLLSAGDSADVVQAEIGSIGMTTCYDLRFPELYRYLLGHGAEIVIVPAAWPAARLEHWQLFVRARAVENQVFLLACNAGGLQGDVELAGHSAVIDPWGRTLAEAGTGEQVLVVDIDVEEVGRTRKEFPVLDDRRIHTTSSFVREDS